jgi:hypothetical protein
MKHLIEEQLILYYYGEAEDEPSIEEHLTSCDSCRADFQELKQVLTTVDTFPVPERSADYGSEVWNRLRPQLQARSPFRWAPFLRPQRLVWAGAIAAMVMVAFLLGRFWPRAEAPMAEQKASPQAMPAQISERVLLASVADHLERSQMILLDLSHTAGGREVDISADQAWAQDLLAENRIYRQSSLRSGEVGIASILEDLERILLEIANSPSRISSAELAEIRQRIEAQGIIFKLRIIGSSIRQKQDEAARELARRSS